MAITEQLRTLKYASWLGWQIESNWADPFLFFIYSVLRPIASVMILVVMYLVIARSETQAPLFAYIYIGNAFYIFVTGVMVGVSWAVIDDREHYGTLKYIYLSPIPYISYLFGRGVARLVTALFDGQSGSTFTVDTLLSGRSQFDLDAGLNAKVGDKVSEGTLILTLATPLALALATACRPLPQRR